MTITEAVQEWIRRADPDSRRVWLETGSYGPGRGLDLAPYATRLRDLRAALGTGNPRKRSLPRGGAR